MDRNEAIKAARNGAIAALISGAVTLAMTTFAMMSGAEGDLGFFNDPTIFIDLVLIFACAIGMFRMSRAAAVFILIYFILSKIIIGLSLGRLPGIGVALIFIYFYARAIQGTFTYHRIEKAENPDYKPPARWYAYVGIPLGIVLFLLIALGTLTMTGALPSTEVLAGARIPDNQVQTLLDEGIIEPGEQVEYFYSAGVASIMEDGTLFTDRRVISYFQQPDGELELYELYFPDISSIELVEQGDLLTDSIYQVNGPQEDTWLQVVLSTEAGGDVRFVEALQRKVDQARRATAAENADERIQPARHPGVPAARKSETATIKGSEPFLSSSGVCCHTKMHANTGGHRSGGPHETRCRHHGATGGHRRIDRILCLGHRQPDIQAYPEDDHVDGEH